MKTKGFNIYDAFTVLISYLLFTGQLRNPFLVLIPWVIEVMFLLLFEISVFYGWWKRFKFWIWKIATNRQFKKTVTKAREQALKN